MRRRVILGGLFHETHTFLKGLTRLEDFSMQLGEELCRSRGDSSPLGGFWEVADRHRWQVIPTVDMRAMPGPVVADEVVERFWNEFCRRAEPALRRGVEAIFLVLHGAMVSQSLRDVEGQLLEQIRTLKGAEEVPVCGVVDLHANFTPRMARHTQGLIAYRENPHTDARAAAVDAAALLERMLATGERPQTLYERAPVMWPPTGTCTAEEPMILLEQTARGFESEHEDILAVNVLGGFAFADTHDTGVSFTALTRGSPETARELLRELSLLTVREQVKGNRTEPPIESIIERLRTETRGPIVITEPSDNIGGGAPGDCTGGLRALVDSGLQNCACVINDPEAVKAMAACQPGDRRTVEVGGKGSELGGSPLRLELELLRLSDGRFELEDKHSHMASLVGSRVDMGPCAVVRTGGVKILLTSRKTPPFDLGQLRSQGIVPEEQFVILVKAAVAHRRAYDPVARRSFAARTPGPCSSDLKALPYLHVRRPIFPLEGNGPQGG